MTLIEINPNGLWRQRRFEFCNALEAALDDTLSADSRSAAWEALAMYGVSPHGPAVRLPADNGSFASDPADWEQRARTASVIHAEEDDNGEARSSIIGGGK